MLYVHPSHLSHYINLPSSHGQLESGWTLPTVYNIGYNFSVTIFFI